MRLARVGAGTLICVLALVLSSVLSVRSAIANGAASRPMICLSPQQASGYQDGASTDRGADTLVAKAIMAGIRSASTSADWHLQGFRIFVTYH